MGQQDQALTPHPEVLTARQRRALRELGPVMEEEGYYLAGGTAIALLLGHRRSADLDWFSQGETSELLSLVGRVQGRIAGLSVHRLAAGTLHGDVAGVRLSLLEYRYPLLQPLIAWSEYGCRLASLDDLACMKLAAVAQRGTKRDFVDVYALGLRHRPIAEVFELYGRKYGMSDKAHLLYALSYFDDAEGEPMPRMLWRVNWRTVKATIQGWVREMVG